MHLNTFLEENELEVPMAFVWVVFAEINVFVFI